jgi:hypothetical protein
VFNNVKIPKCPYDINNYTKYLCKGTKIPSNTKLFVFVFSKAKNVLSLYMDILKPKKTHI